MCFHGIRFKVKEIICRETNNFYTPTVTLFYRSDFVFVPQHKPCREAHAM